MENSFQTSFIPKKPIYNGDRKKETRGPIGILSIVAIVTTLSVCLWMGGVFFYKNLLIKQKETLSQSLLISRESFEKDTITELELFNKKVDISKELIKNHYILSPFFEKLSEVTIPSIQFTKFEYQLTGNLFVIKMSGLAKDYTSIALQAKEFNQMKSYYFKNVVFSNLVLSENENNKGYISFDISFTIDKSLLSYENNLILNSKTKTNETNKTNPTNPITPTTNSVNDKNQIKLSPITNE